MKKSRKKQMKRAALEFAVLMSPYFITAGMIVYWVIFGY